MIEFDSPIRTEDKSMMIFTDQNDDGVWLSIHASHGTMHTTLTKEEAKEMIRRLTLIVEAL